MKKIGLIAGIGPVSTVEYYNGIISEYRARSVDLTMPEMILYSANMAELNAMMDCENWAGLTDWLVEKVGILEAAGADFSAIASNSPHVVFDEVRDRSPIPLISIVEATLHKTRSLGLHRPGLMGTRFTMRHGFFEKTFEAAGIPVFLPDNEDRELIHHRLFSEIVLGVVKDSTRTDLLGIVKRMIDRHSIDSLILGCTELPTILDRDEFGIPFLNTAAIHVESIVDYSMGE